MRAHGFSILLTALALILAPTRLVHTAFWDAGGPAVVLAAMERLTPDLLASPVAFSVRTAVSKDAVFIPDLEEDPLESASAWQIQIFNRAGRKVSYLQGRGRPSSGLISWAGVSDTGEPLPDGFYTARLMWLDADKRAHGSNKVSVSLFTPLEMRKLADKKLQLDYTDEGLVVTIAEKMIFSPGDTNLQAGALPALREISLFLKSYARNSVIIRGYTDSSGSPRTNQALSQARAARVYKFFVDAGLDPDVLSYKGMGPSNPVASNDTETGRARNRRVDVVVSKNTI